MDRSNQIEYISTQLLARAAAFVPGLARQAGERRAFDTEVAVLNTLRDGPRRITELAEHEGLAQPTTTLLVKRLEELGLVRRQRRADDGRVVLVSLRRPDCGRARNSAPGPGHCCALNWLPPPTSRSARSPTRPRRSSHSSPTCSRYVEPSAPDCSGLARVRRSVTHTPTCGLDYWIWPGRLAVLGSSLSDPFACLPARALSARLPDGADPAPGIQGRRAPGAPARERGAAPPDRPGPLPAGRPAMARNSVATGPARRWGEVFTVTPATLLDSQTP